MLQNAEKKHRKQHDLNKLFTMNFIRKFYYGDIPEDKGGELANTSAGTASDWPLWEVFIRSKQGLDHKHAGSLHAADAQMAIENARDVYTRRMEGVSIWVVESKYIHASKPEEAGSLYEPANDKVYRHPTFYNLPDEVNHM
jgi:ring-1,2-phenylacetyl-CoA epoxidase subunit PaaB